MAVPLRCPNCYDNLGKDVENPKNAYCGTCGHSFHNPRGYDDDEDDDEDPEILQHWKGGNNRSWSDH